eukprot:14920429-Ditylum_brightwellii.AAC.1
MPATSSQSCNGGQCGIPRVAKKPVTVPFSPPLGAKRNLANKPSVAQKSIREKTLRKSYSEQQKEESATEYVNTTKRSLNMRSTGRVSKDNE